MATNTTIELTQEDALLFVAFQKRHAFMQLLDSIGVFDTRSGTVTLAINFDAMGAIGSVEATTKKHYRL